MLNTPSGSTEYREPERPAEVRTPSQRRAWRKYVAAERAAHDRLVERYNNRSDKERDCTFFAWMIFESRRVQEDALRQLFESRCRMMIR